jgi:hypothetical protein
MKLVNMEELCTFKNRRMTSVVALSRPGMGANNNINRSAMINTGPVTVDIIENVMIAASCITPRRRIYGQYSYEQL